MRRPEDFPPPGPTASAQRPRVADFRDTGQLLGCVSRSTQAQFGDTSALWVLKKGNARKTALSTISVFFLFFFFFFFFFLPAHRGPRKIVFSCDFSESAVDRHRQGARRGGTSAIRTRTISFADPASGTGTSNRRGTDDSRLRELVFIELAPAGSFEKRWSVFLRRFPTTQRRLGARIQPRPDARSAGLVGHRVRGAFGKAGRRAAWIGPVRSMRCVSREIKRRKLAAWWDGRTTYSSRWQHLERHVQSIPGACVAHENSKKCDALGGGDDLARRAGRRRFRRSRSHAPPAVPGRRGSGIAPVGT